MFYRSLFAIEIQCDYEETSSVIYKCNVRQKSP